MIGIKEKIGSAINRILKRISYRGIFIFVVIAFVLTIAPMVYCSFFAYASSDDMWNAYALRRAIVHGYSLSETIQALKDRYVQTYVWWAGNWVSIFLWLFCPSVWGERLYTIVPLTSMAAIVASHVYMIRYYFRKYVSDNKHAGTIIGLLVATFVLQLMPSVRSGVYMYTVVINYVIPYSVLLISFVWMDKFLTGRGGKDTGESATNIKVGYLVLISLVYALLGGVGYPVLVFGAEVILLVILWGVLSGFLGRFMSGKKCAESFGVNTDTDFENHTEKDSENHTEKDSENHIEKDSKKHIEKDSENHTEKDSENHIEKDFENHTEKDSNKHSCKATFHKTILLLIPLILFGIGFMINVKSPGNAVRGGDNYTVGVQKIFGTLFQAISMGAKNLVLSFLENRLLVILFIIIFVIAFELIEVDSSITGHKLTYRYPYIVIPVMFLVYAGTYAPQIFSQDEIFSGGVPNTIFFVLMLTCTVSTIYLAGFCKKVYLRKLQNTDQISGINSDQSIDKDLHQSSDWNTDLELSSIDKQNPVKDSSLQIIRNVILIMILLLSLLGSRFLIGPTTDYTIYRYVSEGHLADFDNQMKEQIALLTDPNTQDVVLNPIGDEQGPFMYMPVTTDPTAYTNRVLEEYYEKDSVVVKQ